MNDVALEAAPATMMPDITLDVRTTFGIDSDMHVPAFSNHSEHVPDADPTYKFDRDTTLAILAGFAFNRRVMIQGYHGTGKSTHIEQVAARLNWPCIRVNLDSHISRIDLIGKDAIVLKDGKQITEFREGILPWALQHNCALVFDEYDAGRPDVMFVIQRVLEVEGKLTLLDQNKVIRPHPGFRLFATANTVGLGDTTGLYHGTQQINQGQMDRWNIVATLNYLPHAQETEIVLAKMGTDGPRTRRPRSASKAWWHSPISPAPASSTATSPPSCRRAPSSPGPRTRESSTISASHSASPSSTNAMKPSAAQWPNTISAASTKTCPPGIWSAKVKRS